MPDSEESANLTDRKLSQVLSVLQDDDSPQENP